MKAIWKGQVIAESDKTINIEGNQYFPHESIHAEYFRKNDFHTACPWKGVASYYDVVVNDEINENAAWYYPETQPAANGINNYVAFWRGVEVVED